jgi:hypothetical protein
MSAALLLLRQHPQTNPYQFCFGFMDLAEVLKVAAMIMVTASSDNWL